MSSLKSLSLLVAVAAISVAAPVSAQSTSSLSSSALDAAVAARPAGNRVLVTRTLSSPEAVATAAKLGVSATQLSTRIAALDEISVNQYADQIRAAGRANVVISTTAIIIGLLILILLVG